MTAVPRKYPASLNAFCEWHRNIGPDLTMIDIDGLLYCEDCKKPIALIEARKGDGKKHVTVLCALARAANIRALLIYYWPCPKDSSKLCSLEVHDALTRRVLLEHTTNLDAYIALEKSIRSSHTCHMQAFRRRNKASRGST